MTAKTAEQQVLHLQRCLRGLAKSANRYSALAHKLLEQDIPALTVEVAALRAENNALRDRLIGQHE